ncbi:hypothetical protein M0R36_10280, partial [bacterium]|nr:hypothetical protein [bacterium]
MDIIQNEILIRDKFLRYPEIKEIDTGFINEIKESSGFEKEWIATEKIRGIHISLVADKNQVKIANKINICHDSIFDHLVLNSVSCYFEAIKKYCSDNKISMQIYGVFFGGYYNNNFSVIEHTPMDTLITYSMNHHWWAYDIKINSEFVSWEKLAELTTLFGISCVPVLRKSNLSEIIKLSPEKYLSMVSYILHNAVIENNYVEGFVIRSSDVEKTQKGNRMMFKNIRHIMRRIEKRKFSSNSDTKGNNVNTLDNFYKICDKYMSDQRFISIFTTIGKPKSKKDLGSYLSTYCKSLYDEMSKENIKPNYIKTIQKISVYRLKSDFYGMLADMCVDGIERKTYQDEYDRNFSMYIDEYGNAVMDAFKIDDDKTKNVESASKPEQKTEDIKPVNNNETTKEIAPQFKNNPYYYGYDVDDYDDYSPTHYSPASDTTIHFIACKDVDEKDLLVPSYKEKKAPGFGFYTIEDMIINPDEVKMIRSGWRCKIEEEYILYFEARNSLDSNKDIHVLTKPNIVTSDYEDELKFVVWNNSKESINIPKNTMIVYGILCKTEKVYIDVV